MFDLTAIVSIVVKLLVGGAVLALLWFLVNYIEAQVGGPPLVFKVIRIVFVVLVVLLLIGLLLNLMGVPMVRW